MLEVGDFPYEEKWNPFIFTYEQDSSILPRAYGLVA